MSADSSSTRTVATTGTDRRIESPAQLDTLRFDGDGLLPVVAHDARDGRVLMLAWANREALEQTLATGQVHFWSRSRGQLWLKGETSGNVLHLVSLHSDCDGDTVLARVHPAGPACHTLEPTCFGAATSPTLAQLWETLQARASERPEGSYTVRLLDDPNLRIKKLGEETAELIQALVQNDGPRATEEAADLLYHTLVALLANGIDLADLLRELDQRS